jgi:predicted enzyme related to lactoylglutathione lyase
MPERDGYIPGVPCWIDTSQPDPEAAVDFYSGLFGWEFEDVMPPESEGTSGSRAQTRPLPASSTRAARR